MTEEPDNWRSLRECIESAINAIRTKHNYGWFEHADDNRPAHDPWPNAFCPYCGETVTPGDCRSFNFTSEDLPWSYFYYTHRSCDVGAGPGERDAAFRYVVDQVLGKPQ